jgi:hypothetical protein
MRGKIIEIEEKELVKICSHYHCYKIVEINKHIYLITKELEKVNFFEITQDLSHNQ